MPTYEYVCTAGHAFERFQSMSEKPVRKCPKCGKSVKKQMSVGGGLLFKGAGFYITDYRSADYKAKAKAESGSGTTGTSGDAAGKSGGETTKGTAEPKPTEGTLKKAAAEAAGTAESSGSSTRKESKKSSKRKGRS